MNEAHSLQFIISSFSCLWVTNCAESRVQAVLCTEDDCHRHNVAGQRLGHGRDINLCIACAHNVMPLAAHALLHNLIARNE